MEGAASPAAPSRTMARNEQFIDAPPREVWGVLADPRCYATWVVGTSEVRAADPDWPRPGSVFRYGVTYGPVRHRGLTRVIAATALVHLELHIHAAPMPDARVIIELQPEGEGTRLSLTERPAHRLLSALSGPLGHGLIRLRNRESVRRLAGLAEGRLPLPTGSLPPLPNSALE